MSERTDKERLDFCATHSFETDGRPYITLTREMIDEGMDDYEIGTVQQQSAATPAGGDGK